MKQVFKYYLLGFNLLIGLVLVFTMPSNHPSTYDLEFKTVMASIVVGVAVFIALILSANDFYKKKNLPSVKPDFFGEEVVIIEGNAKYLSQNKKIRGKLYLTNTRLVFYSKNIDFKVLMLKELARVEVFDPGYFLKRGLKFFVNGEQERFLVDYPKDWKILIELQSSVFINESSLFLKRVQIATEGSDKSII